MGVVIFFPTIFGATLLAGGGTAGALGLAAFASFFGGMGFGAMLGGVIHLVQAEDAEAARAERTAAVSAHSDSPAEVTAVPIGEAA